MSFAPKLDGIRAISTEQHQTGSNAVRRFFFRILGSWEQKIAYSGDPINLGWVLSGQKDQIP
jgi:hypothetical protein